MDEDAQELVTLILTHDPSESDPQSPTGELAPLTCSHRRAAHARRHPQTRVVPGLLPFAHPNVSSRSVPRV